MCQRRAQGAVRSAGLQFQIAATARTMAQANANASWPTFAQAWQRKVGAKLGQGQGLGKGHVGTRASARVLEGEGTLWRRPEGNCFSDGWRLWQCFATHTTVATVAAVMSGAWAWVLLAATGRSSSTLSLSTPSSVKQMAFLTSCM